VSHQCSGHVFLSLNECLTIKGNAEIISAIICPKQPKRCDNHIGLEVLNFPLCRQHCSGPPCMQRQIHQNTSGLLTCSSFTVCVCVCVCVFLGFELRALHLQGRHSMLEPCLQPGASPLHKLLPKLVPNFSVITCLFFFS
jgi:hypothetical protein